MVHSTFSVQPANQQRRNATQSQEPRAHGQRRQKVPQGEISPQQAQVQGDDRPRAQGREGLFPAEDHRQHRGQVQDQERFRRQEDPGMDVGQEDGQELRRQVPPGHRQGEAVWTVREGLREETLVEEAQDEQEGQEEEVIEEEEVEEEGVRKSLEEEEV